MLAAQTVLAVSGEPETIVQLFVDAAPHYAQKPLFWYQGGGVSYAEMSRAIATMAGHLRMLGVDRGERVLLLAQNKPAWFASFIAALQVGAICVPVNPALTAAEIGYIVSHAEPSVALVDHALRAVLPADGIKHIIDIDEDGVGLPGTVAAVFADPRPVELAAADPAVMFYTSGTTGRPKGALLSHGAEAFTANLVARHFELRPDDVSLIASPLSFIYPLVIDCLASIRAGATIVLMERFHPEHVLRTMEREKASIFMGVPTMYTMMLEWAEGQELDISSMRFCISAGQNLSWSVTSRFRSRFGIPVYDLWGQTEGTPITSYHPSTEPDGRPESCGRALPGCDVRVIDDVGGEVPAGNIGEVILTGPNMMMEYYRNPEATALTLRNGWIYTGDLGRIDQDGYLYIVGRKRDLIIRGGANIYPSEVEEAIYTHPAVSECAVIGVPDSRYGESVKACVAVRPGFRFTADDLKAHCRTLLAEYKLPTEIAFFESLPKGPTGKILKRALREQ